MWQFEIAGKLFKWIDIGCFPKRQCAFIYKEHCDCVSEEKMFTSCGLVMPLWTEVELSMHVSGTDLCEFSVLVMRTWRILCHLIDLCNL